MKQEFDDEELLDYLEGHANPDLEEALKSEEALQKRLAEFRVLGNLMKDTKAWEPPAHVKSAIDQSILEATLTARGSKRQVWLQVAAAAALLILGFAAGKLSVNQPDTSQEMVALLEEVKQLKGLTLEATLKQHSASERIYAVNQIETAESIDEALLGTLVNTLNSDKSPNVRYEALHALSHFMDVAWVKAELIKSLEQQEDPFIQISMINILVAASEYGAKAPLEKIIKNESTKAEVKRQAELALKILS